jgi:hypothetical protein
MKLPAAVRPVALAARNAMARSLAVLPGSSCQIGPPRRLVRDTLAAARLSAPGDHGDVQVRMLTAAREIVRTPPVHADPPIARRLAVPTVSIKPRFVAEFPHGRFWGRGYGYIISPDDALHADLSPALDDTASQHDALLQPLLPRVRPVRGTIASLGTLYCENFHHWLLDAVPKLSLLRDSGWTDEAIAGYLLPATACRPWHQEVLARLDIPTEKIIRSDARTHVQADRLLVPSASEPGREPERFAYTPEGLAFVRGLFADAMVARGDWPEKIVVSRELATSRRWTAGDAGHARLQREGFVKVLLERHTLAEQAALFAHARQIVMPTGGGLANLAFCAPGTQVVELFDPAYLPTFSFVLSSALDLAYTALVGDAPTPVSHSDAGSARDIAVPAERTLSSLR